MRLIGSSLVNPSIIYEYKGGECKCNKIKALVIASYLELLS
jgi:hypothetical protein